MAVVAGNVAARSGRSDNYKSKHAPPAVVARPAAVAQETDPLRLLTSRPWKFCSSSNGLVAEKSKAAYKEVKPAPRPSPPPAPRLRPAVGKATVPFMALESEDEGSEADEIPQCPAAPRLGLQAEPPCALDMPPLMLPPSISSFDTIEEDEPFELVFSALEEADSKAEEEHRSSGTVILDRMVSASASTACADDLEERSQSPGLPDMFSKCNQGWAAAETLVVHQSGF